MVAAGGNRGESQKGEFLGGRSFLKERRIKGQGLKKSILPDPKLALLSIFNPNSESQIHKDIDM